MDMIKSKHRTSLLLKNWSKDNYWYKQDKALDVSTLIDSIERVHVDKITVEEFIQKYEKGSLPVIITGVAEGWPAWQQWQVKVSNWSIYLKYSAYQNVLVLVYLNVVNRMVEES